MKMSTERSWNDTGSAKPKYSERNLFQFPLVQHKFHMEWSGLEHGPQGDRLAT
jgi:hypothetical protein